jgi:predicted transcriptional regulator
MSADRVITERILNVLRPYASNWSGTLSRGDLVIPQAEVPRLIREILGAVREVVERHGEAADLEVFQTLMASRKAVSVQDVVAELRKKFLILNR